jgi:hypothetical protein
MTKTLADRSTRQLKADAKAITTSTHVDGGMLATIDKELRRRKAAELPNIHPADELCAVREEMKILQARSEELRDQLLAEGASLKGDQYTAQIQPGVRETLDRKAITEAFGEAAVAPFIKATAFKTVKLVENPEHAKA